MKETYLVTCAAAVLAASVLLPLSATADQPQRLVTFPAALQGTWAQTPDQCGKDDKSNVVIQSAEYDDGAGTCAVQWIVETPGSVGANYNVRALCTSADDPSKSAAVNIIIRPEAGGRTWMSRLGIQLVADPTTGRLPNIHPTYQQCPASPGTSSGTAAPSQQ